MNCDQVFDVLTRGPFPTGDPSDAAVELHLSLCEDCRRLAEALRPVVEVERESLDPEESRSLPGYSGRLYEWSNGGSVASRLGIRRAGRKLLAKKHDLAKAWSSAGAWQFVAAVMAGAFLAVLIHSQNIGERSENSAKGVLPAGVETNRSQVRITLGRHPFLASLAVSPSCLAGKGTESDSRDSSNKKLSVGPIAADADLPVPAVSPLENDSTATSADVACCSRCHSADSTVATTRSALGLVARSCQYCHAR